MPELAGIEFVQTIGRGAMGAVYLARQTALNRYVAAKQILGAWNGDPEMLARFQREARALAQMNHPNVVGIYDLTTSGNDLFMIMEYVRGPSLRELMNAHQLSVAQALRTLGDVSAALEYASKRGIVHRDLKPGNVFVTVAGSSKLGDFGLVKMVQGQANFQTQAGTILGTPAYMSPEQAEGKSDIDQRTDVYSLAVMSYELLTGRLPFPSIPGNIMASLDAHISQPPPKPSDIVPGFPKHVEEALLEGLAKDPKKRPRSAGEFWQRLLSAASRAWAGWERDSDLAAIALAAAPPAPPPLPAPGAPAITVAPNSDAMTVQALPAPITPPAMAPPPIPLVAPPPPTPGAPPPLASVPAEPALPVSAPDETMARPLRQRPMTPWSDPCGSARRHHGPTPGGPTLDETISMPAANAAAPETPAPTPPVPAFAPLPPPPPLTPAPPRMQAPPPPPVMPFAAPRLTPLHPPPPRRRHRRRTAQSWRHRWRPPSISRLRPKASGEGAPAGSS